jgi:hypothetical protein
MQLHVVASTRRCAQCEVNLYFAGAEQPTQNQTPIRCGLTVEGISNSPGSDDD